MVDFLARLKHDLASHMLPIPDAYLDAPQRVCRCCTKYYSRVNLQLIHNNSSECFHNVRWVEWIND